MKRPLELEETVGVVADHYNNRQNQGEHERAESQIFQLRGFNNWVKSVLISLYTRPGMRVLDLAGGKGGDLKKWRVADISHLVLADVAHISVKDARDRYLKLRNSLASSLFPALFVAADCFNTRFMNMMDPALRVDLVSCQFAFHYAFESEARVRTAFSNVSDRLEAGGHFVATIPNALRLVQLFRSVPGNVWKNSICRLEFDRNTDKDVFPEFGARYSFFLADAVDSVPEYLVHPAVLERIAAEYDLELVLRKEFPEWKAEYEKDPRFEDLMHVMQVERLSPDEWQAASLYVVVCFRKKGDVSALQEHQQRRMLPNAAPIRYETHDYNTILTF